MYPDYRPKSPSTFPSLEFQLQQDKTLEWIYVQRVALCGDYKLCKMLESHLTVIRIRIKLLEHQIKIAKS